MIPRRWGCNEPEGCPVIIDCKALFEHRENYENGSPRQTICSMGAPRDWIVGYELGLPEAQWEVKEAEAKDTEGVRGLIKRLFGFQEPDYSCIHKHCFYNDKTGCGMIFCNDRKTSED